METSQILNELKTRRGVLEKTRDDALAELSQVNGAILAMEGKPNGKAVTDMIYEAGLALTAPFDNKALKMKAIALHPKEEQRIKTGVYSAVANLLKQKRFEKTPGGLKMSGS